MNIVKIKLIVISCGFICLHVILSLKIEKFNFLKKFIIKYTLITILAMLFSLSSNVNAVQLTNMFAVEFA